MRPHESLHRPDIKDIGPEITKQESVLLFDTRQDLSLADQVKMREAMYDKQLTWPERARTIADYRDLDPNFDPSTEVDDVARVAMRVALPLQRNRGDWDKWEYFARLACALRTIDPTFHIDTDIFPSDRKGMHEELQKIRERSGATARTYQWLDFARMIVNVQRIDPDFDATKEVAEAECLGMRQTLDRWRWSPSPLKWQYFAELASALCQFDPTFHPEVEITPEDRQGLRDEMQALRASGKWAPLTWFASNLQKISNRMQQPSIDAPGTSLPATRTF